MAEFKWTEFTLLLTILLHLPANTRGQEDKYVYHRVGEEVTLPCDTRDCDEDQWLFHGYKVETLSLVRNGKIDNKRLINDKAREQRLRVERICSLVIKNITVEDVGRYICWPEGPKVKSSYSVSLFNISQTPSPGTDLDPSSSQLLLSCSIVRFNQHRERKHSLRWIDKDNKIWKETSEDKQFDYNDTVTIQIPQERSNSEVFRCELTGGNGQVIKSIDFTAGPSVKNTAPPAVTSADLTFILVAVGGGVLLILVAMVLIIMYRKRAKGRQTPTDGNTVQADPDEGLTYVSINHSNKNHTTRRAKVPDDDAVTYATVKVPTASAGH